jgi:hypothetical protein
MYVKWKKTAGRCPFLAILLLFALSTNGRQRDSNPASEEVTCDDRWPEAYQRIGALEDKTDRIFALAGMNYIQNQYPQREWKQAGEERAG